MYNPIPDPFVEGPFVEAPDTDASSKLVTLEATVEGAVTVTMNRPEKKNAFNAELIGALRETFETLARGHTPAAYSPVEPTGFRRVTEELSQPLCDQV